MTARIRSPRPKEPHPCRVCTEPVLADAPDNALHPDCKIDAPRCITCGRGPTIPDPHCSACAGTGTLSTSACPWCQPGPCATCVMTTILASVRRDRDRHSGVGPCAVCDLVSALPFGPLCVDCTRKEEADWDAWITLC